MSHNWNGMNSIRVDEGMTKKGGIDFIIGDQGIFSGSGQSKGRGTVENGGQKKGPERKGNEAFMEGNRFAEDDLPGMTGAQRAAKLLLSLGPDEAARIIQELDVADIENLVNEMARIRSVSPEEKKSLLGTLNKGLDDLETTTIGGLDRTRDILTRGLGQEKAREMLSRFNRRDLEKDFEFLDQVDPVQFAAALSTEHPQIAAVALSCISPKIAALVIRQFEPDMRADVARRIGQTSRTHPDAIHRVARVLREKFEKRSDELYSETGGAEMLANILNHMDRKTEDEIMEVLDGGAPEVYRSVKDLLYTFEELMNLDVREMRHLLAQVNDDYILAAALRGAGDALHRHFFNALSQNRAADILEEMEYRGPINVREINEARSYILTVARKMDDGGEIIIKKEKEEFI